MKTLIFRGAPINRLLDNELKDLMDADIEFAITNNNNVYGIDNKNEIWPFNTNTLVFMWPEYYVEEQQNWIDKINDSANVVGKILKNIFEYRTDANWEPEWKHLVNVLNHMNAHETIVYDLNYFTFGAN